MTSTLPPLVQAFSGAIGSASANALTYPLDLVTTRLQLDSPRRSKERGGIQGAIQIFNQILRKRGLGAFYNGLWADTCATLLSNFFYFYFYSFLRQLSTKRLIPFVSGSGRRPHADTTLNAHKPTLVEDLVLGFVAGVASRAISTPLNIITLRLQTEREEEETDDVGGDEEVGEEAGIADVVRLVYKEQGLIGFWRGFQMSAMLSLNPSITLAFFQLYRRLLALAHSAPLRAVKEEGLKSAIAHAPAAANPRPWEAFFGAATANSIAVSLLYPLILGKKRLQASASATMREVLVDAYLGKEVRLEKQRNELHEKSGVRGLYQGLSVKVIAGFLSQGVTFLVKSRIEQLIVAVYLLRLRRARAVR